MVIKVGEIYPSNNCGDMEVIEYVNTRKVLVRFIQTGFERYTYAHCIRIGGVKDPCSHSIYGVGYLGEGTYKVSVSGKTTKEYDTWHSMLRRCYGPKAMGGQSTYIGCTVVNDWHNFQVFGKWFTKHYIEGYELDKDIKVLGNKVYGPDTCMFVTHTENTVAARAITVTFKNPEGGRVEVYNIRKFARENGLIHSALSNVKNGKRNHHQGWTLWKEEEAKSGR